MENINAILAKESFRTVDDYTEDEPVINPPDDKEPYYADEKPFDSLDLLTEHERDVVFDSLDDVRSEIVNKYGVTYYDAERIMKDYINCC